MSNKEFYEKILAYEAEGKLLFMPKVVPDDFIRIIIDTRSLGIHKSIYDFGQTLIYKADNAQFFTQKMLERYIGKSASVVMRLLLEGKYALIKRNWTKFYIKKDW